MVEGTIGRAAVAIRLAREGVPILAIARVLECEAAAVNDLLTGAVRSRALQSLPPLDWDAFAHDVLNGYLRPGIARARPGARNVRRIGIRAGAR